MERALAASFSGRTGSFIIVASASLQGRAIANKWLAGVGFVDYCSAKSAGDVRGSFRGRLCRFLICVGDRSFGIYLTHILVMRMLADFPFYRDLPIGVNTMLVFLVSFLSVSIGVSILGRCGSAGRHAARWLGLS